MSSLSGQGAGEGGWRDYWEGISPDKAFFRHEARDYVERLNAAVGLDNTQNVLDFGCGFGHVAEFVAPRVASVRIWDSAVSVREAAVHRLRDLANVDLLDLGGPEAPSEMQGLDLILIHSVIQYMSPDELKAQLAVWRDLLAVDGRIVISDVIPPDVDTTKELIGFLRFGLRNGFLFDAILNGLKEIPRYFGTRKTGSLLCLAPEELRDQAMQAGLDCEVLAQNLSYRQQRFTVVLRRG
jgi:SAM-dependent methyltransferase